VPGLLSLIEGQWPSGRYKAREVGSISISDPQTGDPQTGNVQTGDVQSGVRETRIVLTVRDIAHATQLWRDNLHLKPEKEWHDDEGSGVVFDSGRATIELLDEADAAYTDRVEVGRATHQPMRLALAVDDVLQVSSAIQQGGATPLGEVRLTPWGHFNQRLQTPEGVPITLFQERAAARAAARAAEVIEAEIA
jgi:hypothetical protein